MTAANNRSTLTTRGSHLRYTLDEDFIKMFAPFRFIQKVFGSCRVDIRDRQVTAPTVFQKCYTALCFIVSTYFGRSFINYADKSYTEDRIAQIYVIGLSVLHFVCALGVFHCRFINQGNVELYEKMHSIDRVMKLNWSGSNKLRIKHYKHNRAVVLSLVASFSALSIGSMSLTVGILGVQELVSIVWALHAFIFDIVCCASHLIYFKMRVNLINSMIEKHLKTDKLHAPASIIDSFTTTYVTNKQSDFESNETDMYLNEIFSAFICFQNQYRFQVMVFCSIFVGWLVLSFRFAIIALQSNVSMSTFILDRVHVTTITTTQFSMLAFLSIRSEAFRREVKRTKTLCTSILSHYLDGPLREKAKRMLKLIEHHPPRFCVYGMWRLDARLLLNMFTIISSSFVILLQFAFL